MTTKHVVTLTHDKDPGCGDEFRWEAEADGFSMTGSTAVEALDELGRMREFYANKHAGDES